MVKTRYYNCITLKDFEDEKKINNQYIYIDKHLNNLSFFKFNHQNRQTLLDRYYQIISKLKDQELHCIFKLLKKFQVIRLQISQTKMKDDKK